MRAVLLSAYSESSFMINRLLHGLIVVVMLGLVPVKSVAGEVIQPESPKDLPAQIDALKEGQAKIRQELQEIKGLLKKLLQKGRTAGAGMPKNLVLSIKDDPFKGSSTAKVMFIEFSDYLMSLLCPACAGDLSTD